MLDTFSKCLDIDDAEQKMFTRYKSLETYVAPISVRIGERSEFRNVNNIQTLVHIPVNAQFIPLRFVLKLFFDLPNIFKETLEYMNDLKLNDKVITNFVQGQFWKERVELFGEKIVMSLIMYFDDYENNPTIILSVLIKVYQNLEQFILVYRLYH